MKRKEINCIEDVCYCLNATNVQKVKEFMDSFDKETDLFGLVYEGDLGDVVLSSPCLQEEAEKIRRGEEEWDYEILEAAESGCYECGLRQEIHEMFYFVKKGNVIRAENLDPCHKKEAWKLVEKLGIEESDVVIKSFESFVEEFGELLELYDEEDE